MTLGLFDSFPHSAPEREALAPGAVLLRAYLGVVNLGAAGEGDARCVEAIESVVAEAPFRHMVTPGGFRMSVAMTNCGQVGWVTDLTGYRYAPLDPETGRPWPAIPGALYELGVRAAEEAGYPGYAPDSCLINRYEPGTRLSLHQDRNERDFSAPIVSVSLGLPATFLFGGSQRSERPRRIPLDHGDIVVWGGRSRLAFHGVAPLEDGHHALLGRRRVNVTFRKAL